jgi:hypothetical protein
MGGKHVLDSGQRLIIEAGFDRRPNGSHRWALNSDLRGLDSKTSYRFYVGSYGRSTAILSVSDVDLLHELPYALYARFDSSGSTAMPGMGSLRFSLTFETQL